MFMIICQGWISCFRPSRVYEPNLKSFLLLGPFHPLSFAAGNALIRPQFLHEVSFWLRPQLLHQVSSWLRPRFWRLRPTDCQTRPYSSQRIWRKRWVKEMRIRTIYYVSNLLFYLTSYQSNHINPSFSIHVALTSTGLICPCMMYLSIYPYISTSILLTVHLKLLVSLSPSSLEVPALLGGERTVIALRFIDSLRNVRLLAIAVWFT